MREFEALLKPRWCSESVGTKPPIKEAGVMKRLVSVFLALLVVMALASVAGAETRTSGPGPLERPTKISSGGESGGLPPV